MPESSFSQQLSQHVHTAFQAAMETSGNSYVMSSRRHVRTFAFITPSVTLDALGPGQGVEQSFPSWALIPASGRAGRRESLLLVEPSPCVPIPVLGALIGGSPSDPTCWVCSLGFTRKVGGGPLACARHHVTSLALALASGLIQHLTTVGLAEPGSRPRAGGWSGGSKTKKRCSCMDWQPSAWRTACLSRKCDHSADLAMSQRCAP